MKTYRFLVGLCGGWCNGEMYVDANNEDEAYNRASDLVIERLVDAFPALDIDYEIELLDYDDDEMEYDETENKEG